MRIAFKEWAVVVDALGRGEQLLILRKGGIAEGRDGFQVGHERFLLFPTLPGPETLRLESFAEVVAARKLGSLAEAERLRGQHIWRDEVVAERFDRGEEQAIHALALRVWRLPRRIELPMLPNYGGCRSWIEVAEDIPTAGSVPVLDDDAFAAKRAAFVAATGGAR